MFSGLYIFHAWTLLLERDYIDTTVEGKLLSPDEVHQEFSPVPITLVM